MIKLIIMLIIAFIVGCSILICVNIYEYLRKKYFDSIYYKSTKISYEELLQEKENLKNIKNQKKGIWQEYQITELLNNKITGKNNQIYCNIYVPKKDGTTSEIDILFVTSMGIYVIESKNYNGAIFGSEKDKTWTCVYDNSKIKMINPIIQNKNHIKYLQKYLNLPSYYFKSIIVFSNKTKLIKVPESSENFIICQLNGLIEKIYDEMFRFNYINNKLDFSEISNKMEKIINVSDEIRENHVNNVRRKINY